MPENCQKTAEKIYKNNVNPRGMGVLRFLAVEIIRNAPRPITTTDILRQLMLKEPTVRRGWVLKVIEETVIAQVGVMKILVRVGRTKANAYYIGTPIKKQPHELF